MNYDKIVCTCLGVTNGMIKEAIDKGATTLEEVQEATGAGTVCGSCNDDIQHIIDELTTGKK
ncbi:(2Fe-2S)-binding protein [Lachnospiraceae bacterium 62-35]